jgi:Do/DeqQ family serine protease
MNIKNILTTVAISAVTTMAVLTGFNYYNKKNLSFNEPGKLPVNYVGLLDKPAPGDAVDFTRAAEAALPTVVHIKTKTGPREVSMPKQKSPFADLFGNDDFFDQFFGNGGRRYIPGQQASGSGVILSSDGYIVTNNHVIDDADEITVTLNNKKSYSAKVVGTDVNTDLAVIKIDAKDLPYIAFGNSDNVKIGQWVLAVGYPLNLETTVTAGIVSAKSRNIGINSRKAGEKAIESFIQTDAAVNQGNSGGALINTNGELIGINSAIASPTGVYAGYSYAIPVNIVKKIVNDLVKYGNVQRAYLGIKYPTEDLSEEQKEELGIKNTDGVYVTEVAPGGSAEAAGIKKGDVIIGINGNKINSGTELQEQMASLRPGDKVTVSYKRNGKENTVNIILRNNAGNFDLVKNTAFDNLGGEFSTLTDKSIMAEYGIKGGVVIKKINPKGLLASARMKQGFVITRVGGKDIKDLDDFKNAIKTAGRSTSIEGIYPGYEGSYYYGLNNLDGSKSSDSDNY